MEKKGSEVEKLEGRMNGMMDVGEKELEDGKMGLEKVRRWKSGDEWISVYVGIFGVFE